MSENAGDGTTMVLGLGNAVLGDEGFGMHVARRLKGAKLPGHVRVEEGSVGGFDLLGRLEGVERLLVVDAMMVDSPPGELRFFGPGEQPEEPGKRVLSFHQVGPLELMRMRGLLGDEPKVSFLVTRPEKMEWSTELSPALQNAVGEAVSLIKRLCTES